MNASAQRLQLVFSEFRLDNLLLYIYLLNTVWNRFLSKPRVFLEVQQSGRVTRSKNTGQVVGQKS